MNRKPEMILREVLLVLPRDNQGRDARLPRAVCLLKDTADRLDLPLQRDFSRHRCILPDRRAGNGAHNCGKDGCTGAGAVNIPPADDVDMNIVVVDIPERH